jgi:hypothetical protein
VVLELLIKDLMVEAIQQIPLLEAVVGVQVQQEETLQADHQVGQAELVEMAETDLATYFAQAQQKLVQVEVLQEVQQQELLERAVEEQVVNLIQVQDKTVVTVQQILVQVQVQVQAEIVLADLVEMAVLVS